MQPLLAYYKTIFLDMSRCTKIDTYSLRGSRKVLRGRVKLMTDLKINTVHTIGKLCANKMLQLLLISCKTHLAKEPSRRKSLSVGAKSKACLLTFQASWRPETM